LWIKEKKILSFLIGSFPINITGCFLPGEFYNYLPLSKSDWGVLQAKLAKQEAVSANGVFTQYPRSSDDIFIKNNS
jgi:fluoride ion exporter CrcB/FEX